MTGDSGILHGNYRLRYWLHYVEKFGVMLISLQDLSTSRDNPNTTEIQALQESPSSASMADTYTLATPISTSCNEYNLDMYCCSMLHHEPNLEQTSLLQPSVQLFVALMPIDSDTNLSSGVAYGPGNCSDPRLGTDVDTFMQDSDQQFSSTACTDHEPQIITSLTPTAPQISPSVVNPPSSH